MCQPLGQVLYTLQHTYILQLYTQVLLSPFLWIKERSGNFKWIFQERIASKCHRRDEVPGSLNLEIVLSTSALG